jgi:hypothetical protein
MNRHRYRVFHIVLKRYFDFQEPVLIGGFGLLRLDRAAKSQVVTYSISSLGAVRLKLSSCILRLMSSFPTPGIEISRLNL